MSTKLQAFGGHPYTHLGEGLYYCENMNLYWEGGRVYDERSAQHNGIIGAGKQLKEIINDHNISLQ